MRANAILLLAIGAVLSLPAAAGPADEKALAQEIIRGSGIRRGLLIHLGCADGRLTAELGRSGAFLVDGLDGEAGKVAAARKHLEAQGLSGRVSVGRCAMKRLPYPENLANLVVAEDFGGLLKGGLALSEVRRVLCPGGVALLGGAGGAGLGEGDLKATLAAGGMGAAEIVKTGGLWAKFAKPRPKGMDDWTHARRAADGNAVSRDDLGLPAGVRWAAGPIWPNCGWSRVGLTLDGRLFALSPEETDLIARDAYNGLLLWKRKLADPAGYENRRPQLLAAAGGRLFAVLEGKVQALDAATGRTLTTFDTDGLPETSYLRSVLCAEDTLIVAGQRRVQAFDPGTGRLRWQCQAVAGDMAIGEGRLFLLDTARSPYELLSLDLRSGSQRWRSDTGRFGPTTMPWTISWNRRVMNLCFYQQGVLALLSAEGHSQVTNAKVHGVSAKDGKHLWTHPFPMPPVHGGLRDLLFQGGLIWLHCAPEGRCYRGNIFEGLDPLTGAVKKRLQADGARVSCQPDIATSRHFFLQKHFAFVDAETGKMTTFLAGGGSCVDGGLIGNGLWYTLPYGCGCNVVALGGFMAYAPAEAGQGDATRPDPAGRVETGPAYSANPQSAIGNPPFDSPQGKQSTDWPTYRGNPARTAVAASKAPADMKTIWETQVPVPPLESPGDDWKGIGHRRITAPTVAEGKVFLAVPEKHQVLALSAEGGKVLWTYTCGGRLDSPPTIHKGLCLIGCRDGWVYCLRAADGELVWRFRAAPHERRIPAYGQMESVWPVYGSILVHRDLAWFTAGRSSAADGGLVTSAVEPRTGRGVWEARSAAGGKTADGLNDTPVSDGSSAWLRNWRLDLLTGQASPAGGKPASKAPAPHLVGSRYGLHDESWTRTLHSFYHLQQRRTDGRGTDGQLLVLTGDRTYSYRVWESGTAKAAPELFVMEFPASAEGAGPAKGKGLWRVPLPAPMQIEALVLAGDVLLAAGPADARVRKEGFLMSLSSADGSKRGQWPLPAPPAYEGLAVAGGRVYVVTEDGKVLCLGAETH